MELRVIADVERVLCETVFRAAEAVEVRDVVRDGDDAALHRDLDPARAGDLEAQQRRATGPDVALDLGDADLFDPLAFGVVIAAALRSSRRGATFAVVCPPGRPRDLFTESGVDRIVAVVDSVADLSLL